MGYEVIDGGRKGIRVVFADKTFLDFPKMNGQVLVTGDKYSGELLIGDWSETKNEFSKYDWRCVATFPKDSYSYVIQIP